MSTASGLWRCLEQNKAGKYTPAGQSRAREKKRSIPQTYEKMEMQTDRWWLALPVPRLYSLAWSRAGAKSQNFRRVIKRARPAPGHALPFRLPLPLSPISLFLSPSRLAARPLLSLSLSPLSPTTSRPSLLPSTPPLGAASRRSHSPAIPPRAAARAPRPGHARVRCGRWRGRQEREGGR
jgi:hypothetical protein